MSKTLRADLMLLLVALIWGATFPFVSASLPYIHPPLLVFLRFAIGSLFFLIFIFPKLNKTTPKILWAGFILGLFNSGVYLLQTLGMRHLNADTTAFTAAIGVVFVPFLCPLFGLSRLKKVEVFGSLICLLGLYILTGAHLSGFSSSEGLVLLSALTWAGSICYIQKVTPHIKESQLLAFYQMVFLLPFALSLSVADYHIPVLKPIVIFTLLYTGILASACVFLIQMRYQQDTTVTHAAIIYSLEPVFASILAIFVNHLPLTPRILVGGGLILTSILLIELSPRLKSLRIFF